MTARQQRPTDRTPVAGFGVPAVDWNAFAPFIHSYMSPRVRAALGGCSKVAMKPIGLAIAVASTVALAAAAGAARAEDAQVMLVSGSDFSSPALNGAPTTERRTLEWDAAKGRWGLSLGVERRPVGSGDLQLKDVSPGVYYRLTRRLHIGGAVTLAPDQAETLRLGQPQAPAPRVRLETVFKF